MTMRVTFRALTLKRRDAVGSLQRTASGTQMSTHACTPRGSYSLTHCFRIVIIFFILLFYLEQFKFQSLLDSFFFKKK